MIYFVKGTLPDQLDIWRVGVRGDSPERITSQPAHLTYPVLLDRRTLLFLASAPDGSGPWVYGMDVERRVPHRLTSGVEQYTSLAASANGRRVIATVSEPERSLWRVAIADASQSESSPVRITLATGAGFAPRFGPDYLLYVATAGTGESIWKISGATVTQLWAGSDARIIGEPAISADGQLIAFSAKQRDQTLLYTLRSDGSRMRVVSDSLDLRGAPAFAPDGQSITTAADDKGTPHLFRIPLNEGAPTPLVRGYSVDPAWSPDGRFVIYSGPDIGTKFSVAASTAEDAAYSLPPLTLTRGARHLALLQGGRKLVFLQGDIRHKNLWSVDLESGAMQQLTHMPADFDVRDIRHFLRWTGSHPRALAGPFACRGNRSALTPGALIGYFAPGSSRATHDSSSVYVTASTTGPTNSPITPKPINPPMTPVMISSRGKSTPRRMSIGRRKLSSKPTGIDHTRSAVAQPMFPDQ